MDALDHHLHQDLARLGGRHLVEFGRMAEKMEDPFDEPLESRVRPIETVELEPLLLDELAKTSCGHVSIRAHQLQQRRRDRCPHVRLSVGGTHAGEDDDLTAREPRQRLVDEACLPAARFTRHRHHGTAAPCNEAHHRRHQLVLGRAPDESHVVG